MSGKHVPQRTCVGCREVLPKRSLIRIVRTPDGVRIDPSSKAPGRGAYLHDRRTCWERGLKGSLSKALRVELTIDDRNELMHYMDQLPESNG
ncbi:MAG: YlxR family protein [Anaerolineales bacterium]